MAGLIFQYGIFQAVYQRTLRRRRFPRARRSSAEDRLGLVDRGRELIGYRRIATAQLVELRTELVERFAQLFVVGHKYC